MSRSSKSLTSPKFEKCNERSGTDFDTSRLRCSNEVEFNRPNGENDSNNLKSISLHCVNAYCFLLLDSQPFEI